MVYMMLVAHLLGDYLLQWNELARWKARSLWGVAAHGGIVTLAALACAALVVPSWWPYALLIGLVHTAIDVVRARFLRASDPGQELAWYLLDQIAHLAVIMGVVAWSGSASAGSIVTSGRLADPRALAFAIGYLLLLNPAWVLLRFIVRGVWGAEAAPHLGEGEKFGPMVERVLITSFVLAGQFVLVPMVLVPRCLVPYRVQGKGIGVLVRQTSHWAETMMSVLLATAVGVFLRMITA